MNEAYQHIDIIISEFLSGNISPNEKEEFEQWLNASAANKKVFLKSKKAWELSQNQIPPEKIAEDKTRVIEKVQKIQTTQLIRVRRQALLYKIAAILAIPLTFALSWYFLQPTKQAVPSSQLCEVSAPKGHVAKCILPDGSEVWLNTGSTISYNTISFNQSLRQVQLSGEAFFEVAKNEETPFVVNTPVANIRVTGTSFNVKAYAESENFETVLEEGSIELELNNLNRQLVNLIPGERLVYNAHKKNISIVQVDANFFSAWRNGEILFKDATLADLAKELERIYDIQFHLKEAKLGEYRFRGMFSYNNNLIEALEKIKRTAGIDYYIENKEVWLHKK